MATLLGSTGGGYPAKPAQHTDSSSIPPQEVAPEAVDPVDAWHAALEGYFVPDDEEEEAQEEDGAGANSGQEVEEELVLLGDADKLSGQQRQVMLKLKEAMQYSRMKLKQVNLSFSGASVYFFTPMRSDGTPLPSSVLKFDTEECVRDELEKTKKYGRLFGLTTPKVKDFQFLSGADPKEPSSVMQIDLCGGIFGLPEFASAPPVQTFASVIEDELQAKERKVDVMPIINEALERRMYYFTMTSRKVVTMNLAATYKLVRFVGHGILNRAKEGAKRAEKSPALAAGFQRPADVDDLDPQGHFLSELSGKRQTAKEYFQTFVGYEKLLGQKFERKVVAGLCHNDLHGGNLLLDSQGLVWLIDFATVKDNMHVLMDLTKFLAACLFMYLQDNITEDHVRSFGKLLVTTPDATTAMPTSIEEQVRGDATATFVVGLLSRLRHCMCIYESGDDAPDNDGLPFALAFFSWATRMLSYSEPSLHQKGRALYCAIAGAQRLLWEAGVDVGPVACQWIEQNRLIWEGQKGRRLSTSATSGPQLAFYEFGLEFPRYLAQAGASEAWSTDFLTRERVHVQEHCTTITLKFAGRLQPRFVALPRQAKVMLQRLNGVYKDYAPELLELELFYGRILVIGDSGTGKSMLTKQLFSEVAQRQVQEIYAERSSPSEKRDVASKSGVVPLRIPLVDLSRQLEAEPDTSLEADPVSDLLTDWVKRRHGQDSVPHQLICDIRNSSMGTSMQRATSMQSDPALRPDDSNSSQEVVGLLLLLDGLDEASSRRFALLEYLKSLLENEPVHLPVLTSRPGSLGAGELDLLATLGFVSFSMSALTEDVAKQMAERTLRRLGDTPEAIKAVEDCIGDPAYSTLITNPLVLTLLIHVLRKNWADARKQAEAGVVRTASAQRREVLKKTDVYQRAVKLMLHQSDAAKFMLRDGASDLAMMKRLETLKSSRARKFFQGVSWQAHTQQTRSLSWEAMSEACNDRDILKVFRESFEAGRMPIFEPVEAFGGETKLQMTHLSFQELMTGEYTSAIVRHSHAKQQARSYINFFSSSSSKTMNRDRLAEQWWLQVWFHISEMLHPSAFNDWCDCLAEDQRAKVLPGRITYRKMADPIVTAVEGAATMKMRPWEGGGIPLEVEWVDWENHLVKLKPILKTCLRKARLGQFHSCFALPVDLNEVQFPADGVATILRQAARQPDLDVIRRLLRAGVHYGVVDDQAMNPWTLTWLHKNWDAMQVFIDHKAEYTNSQCADVYAAFPAVKSGFQHFTFWEKVGLVEGSKQLRRTDRSKKPAGVLEEAYKGTLTVVPELDVNFADPASGMSPLMYAAAGGHSMLVAALLRSQAAVNAESKEGSTALSFACDCARGSEGVKCVRLLIQAKADVNVRSGKTYSTFLDEIRGRGVPAAFGPAQALELEKIELLADAGYDFNLSNDYGATPLWDALAAPVPGASEQRRKVCQRLLELKADLHTEMKLSNGNTHAPSKAAAPITLIMPGAGAGFWATIWNINPDGARFFFDNGGDPNHRVTFVGTEFSLILWYASSDWELASAADTSILELFLDKGCDLNAKLNWMGFTTMTILAFACQVQVALLLFFNRKGDTGKPKGLLAQDFLSTAKSANNQAAIDTYNDWIMMQKESTAA